MCIFEKFGIFKLFENAPSEIEITASYPAGVIGDTKSNLEAAAAGENMEWTVLYSDAAKVANIRDRGTSHRGRRAAGGATPGKPDGESGGA